LELDALMKEKEKSLKDVERYKKLLKTKKELTNDIIKTLLSLKKEFGKTRKTKLTDAIEAVIKEAKIEESDVTVLIDRFGYVKVTDKSVYERNKETADKENTTILQTKNLHTLYFITDFGKFYKVPIMDLPYGNFRSKSVPVDNYVGKTYETDKERPIYFGIMEDLKKEVLFGTQKGFLKKMDVGELKDIKRNGSQVIKLEEEDLVKFFRPVTGETHLVILTGKGMILKALIKNISLKKKSARGIVGIKLKKDDFISSYRIFDQSEKTIISIEGKEVAVNDIKASPTGRVGKKI